MQVHYSFNEYYELAMEYYRENGNLLVNHLLVVKKDGKEYNLGQWVSRQRKRYATQRKHPDKKGNILTQEQIEKLETIGMIWDVYDYLWNQNYAYLKAYWQEYGNIDIPINYSIKVNGKSINLGSWLAANRTKYFSESLSKTQIYLLEQLGIQWQINIKWEDVYPFAAAYFNEHHHLPYFKEYIVKVNGKSVSVSHWLVNQQMLYHQGRLVDKQKIELLSKIGFFEDRRKQMDNKMYELLNNYYLMFGNTKIPKKYCIIDSGIEYNLGCWVESKKRDYTKGLLSQEEITKLKVLFFPFPVKHPTWDEMYYLALEYYNKHGNLRIKRTYQAELYGEKWNLGVWLDSQRAHYRNKNSLSQEQIEKLERIGIEWQIYQVQLDWNTAYAALKKYYMTYKTLKIDINKCEQLEIKFELKKWLIRQYEACQDGRLDEKQIALLKELGIKWHFDWYKMCTILNECLKEVKTNDLPNDYIYTKNGAEYPLGKWLQTQRAAYSIKKLNKTQIRYLQKAGISFSDRLLSLWDETYNYVLAFFIQHHHLQFSLEYIENFKKVNICEWLQEQKEALNRGVLSKKQILKLKKINVTHSSREEKWMIMFNKVCYLAKLNLDINHLEDYGFMLEDSDNLLKWIISQRSQKSTLSADKIKLLESIGFHFNLRDGNWEDTYLLLKEYILKNPNATLSKDLNVMYKKRLINLGTWIITQKVAYRKGMLSFDKRMKLEAIGIRFDEKNEDILIICSEYGIDYKANQKTIILNTKRVFLGKILWLQDHDILVCIDGKLHPIFSMSDINMQAEYHISQEELVRKYQKSIQKKLSYNGSK